MDKLKRYRHGARNGTMTPDPDGPFVRYEDVAAALEAAREDGLRLDALAALVDEQPDKALLLHYGMHKRGEQKHAGLGLSNTGRTLRTAIDQARGKAAT